MPEHKNYLTTCGRGRLAYHPEWSEIQPWVSYIDGSAGRHFANIYDATNYFKAKNMTLKPVTA